MFWGDAALKPKVYIAWPVPEVVERFLEEHCECRKWASRKIIRYDQLKEEIRDAEGLLLGKGTIDDELLRQAPNLRVVSNISSGYNNLDIDALKKRNIIATHNPGLSSATVADLVLGLMIATARNIVLLDRYVKSGGWMKDNEMPPSLYGIDVHRATVGIVGMGSIGQEVAKRANLGFDMDVLYYNRTRKPDVETAYGARYLPLDDLVRLSDFIVLLVPLTHQTEHMIDERHFRMMKRSAIVINASRGKVVNEQALVEALRAGRIRGAGLDVFEREPVPKDYPLLAMDRVVTLPHAGSSSTANRFELCMSAARNLVAGLKGERPPFLIKEFEDIFPLRSDFNAIPDSYKS